MRRKNCCGKKNRVGKGAGRGFGQCVRRMTKARRMIMDVLESASGHLTAEDIYMKVHSDYPSIGLTTVYRNLDLLVSNNVISRIEFGDRKARYELIKGDKGDLHHHLVCKKCGRIMEYEITETEKEFYKALESRLKKKYSFKIDEHIVKIMGYCEQCA